MTSRSLVQSSATRLYQITQLTRGRGEDGGVNKPLHWRTQRELGGSTPTESVGNFLKCVCTRILILYSLNPNVPQQKTLKFFYTGFTFYSSSFRPPDPLPWLCPGPTAWETSISRSSGSAHFWEILGSPPVNQWRSIWSGPACKDSKGASPFPHTEFVCTRTAMGPRALYALLALLLRHCC